MEGWTLSQLCGGYVDKCFHKRFNHDGNFESNHLEKSDSFDKWSKYIMEYYAHIKFLFAYSCALFNNNAALVFRKTKEWDNHHKFGRCEYTGC